MARTKQRAATLVAKIKRRPFHATGPKTTIDGT
jgi:Txe/YoeB family toxin of Txe-Axe toxin-antitoxin module